ncbi:MAG: adenosylcobinamide-phosphate synthase CbiB [Ahrensia sp.]|nr:adenosylcobinamide-phosphate synthase CbiB [Ahrensia sp.]
MAVLAIALILDWWIGDPDWLWRRIKHPVVWFGAVIDAFDKKRSNATALLFGVLLLIALLLLCLIASVPVWFTVSLFGPLALLLEALVISVFLAQKSLRDHVSRVEVALREEGIEAGRRSVAMIVGRDVSRLDQSGVAKAAIESLAENFSDGVTAPAFWYAIAGLPGLFFFKAVNTADSMIGHRNERYERFGKAAARLDDVMNWIPARLSLLLVVAVVAIGNGPNSAIRVWHFARQDAPRHRSPNAGWPEAGFAGALDLRLGGPRAYGNETVSGVVLNEPGRSHASVHDITDALALFRWICLLLLVLVGGIALIFT